MVSSESKEKTLLVRGMISNGGALLILGLLGYFLNIGFYVAIACGIQYAVFFMHGLPYCSEKFYDLSGSFTHFAVVMSCMTRNTRVRSARQVLAALASTVWMTRLGTFLYSRILRDGKDARFDNIKPVWISWLGAWTVQAAWVTLIQLPVVLLNDRDDAAPLTLVDYLAVMGWLAGFLIEAAADSQKMAFRDNPENKGKYITTGMWRYSRHPNYFGEILMWSSQALAASGAAIRLGSSSLHAAWISPAFTILLLLKVSGVPMVEKAGKKKWGEDPAYMHYITKTSCVVPWLPAPAQTGEVSKEKAG